VADAFLPVYDPVQLMSLAEQVGDNAAQAFLDQYLGMLPERLARIRSSISEGDLEAAMDATLSLKVSSAMVGARRLAGCCRELEGRLGQDAVADTESTCAGLSREALRFVEGTAIPLH
jgi:HPt (histidine-containing phosphotransfer) domain-containing protein